MRLFAPGEQKQYERALATFQSSLDAWQATPRAERGPRPDRPDKPVRFKVQEVTEPTEVMTSDGPAIALPDTFIVSRGDELRIVHKRDANQEGLWVQE